MATNWRISSFNGALLAAYFIPTWTMHAFNIMVSPIHSFYDRPNIAVAFFASDYLHFASDAMVRTAWMLALGRITVVAFFAIFLMLLARPSVRKSAGHHEALAIALGLGSLMCFAMMIMASYVHEPEAMRLHATELLMLLGTSIVLLVERPAEKPAEQAAPSPLQQPELLHNR
jgi:hypothetical protein